MSPTESRLERNRRRWQRRRRRQMLALMLLVPLLVGAAVLGGNIDSLVGERKAPDSPADAAPAIATSTHAAQTPASDYAADLDRRRAATPVTVPVTESYSIHDSDMRTVEGRASKYARYYQPKSHISPRVRWEIARLKKLALERSTQAIVLPSRGIKPTRLAVVDKVFTPSELEPSQRDRGRDFWEIERFYVELAPGADAISTATPQVPEPGTASMLGVGLAWIAVRRRARRLRARPTH